jgi:hypothetical protein
LKTKDQNKASRAAEVTNGLTRTEKPEVLTSLLKLDQNPEVMTSQHKMETIAEELDFAFENRVYNDVPLPIPDSGFDSSTNYENVRAEVQSSNDGYYENVLNLSNYENVCESSEPYENVVAGKPILASSDASYQNLDFCRTKNPESLLYQVSISSSMFVL